MFFERVEFSHFRNLDSTTLHPSPGLNLISGPNGSGKSSVLEALHFVSLGTSFRTHRFQHLIQHGDDCFTLFSQIRSDTNHSQTHRIGISRCKSLQHQTRIDGEDVSRRSSLVHLLPLQVISPESINLLLEGADLRRSFIDWSLFHVEQSFHFHLSSYNRALKQRNALLKSGTSIEGIGQWERLLAEHGIALDNYRKRYLETVSELITNTSRLFIPEIEVSVEYRQGWNSTTTLLDSISASRDTDIRMKHTTVGPHRADINIKANGYRAVDLLSRGQLKLVVVAMKLAQIEHLVSSFNKQPVILVDDFASELDQEHRSVLLDKLLSLETQLFITTPQTDLIDVSHVGGCKMFHVEHGIVKEVV